MANTPNTTKTKNVVDNPILAIRIGKENPIRKLVIHKQNTVTPIPSPRTLCGKISDSMSHVTGEIAPCWNARNVTVKDSTTYGKDGWPSRTKEKMPINSKESVVPIYPVNNIGRLPTLPKSHIPTNVARTEMTPFAIFPINAASVPKPASLKISVP